ncbi:CotH kinase family protein [Nannocystis sp.]|uniref:CotH kinase family protein n=1 Tax=Nannocystis sp. TaxID=1962667 RepID=UPI0025FE0A52|nr:CotH kinase family protein [Nannocystis sp.]MBK7824311.1 CotH kinase family protein [Nannocystis sp.]
MNRGLFAALMLGGCGDAGGTGSEGTGAGTGTGGTGEATPTSSSAGSETGTSDVSGTSAGTDPASTGSGPDLPPPVRCDPEAGGPYWLLEGEPLKTAAITCKTGMKLAGEDFAIDPLPQGAKYDPATATLAWTPGLDQAAVYELTITAVPFAETGTVKIGVADAWDDPKNVPVQDWAIYTEEYGLPVLHLEADPGINPDAYTPATATYRGHVYTSEAKWRGAASLGYPKKSFTVKFGKDDKFNEPELAGGFVDKRKLVLISTFDDNAYVRQRLSYEMWNILDPEHLQIQVYSGVVFLNGAYHGLYTFSDHVDGYLMEDHGLSQAGNLYKARTHDANFRVANKATPHLGLTKEEGLPLDGQPGAYDDLDELVTWVATSTDAKFHGEIDTRIDRRDYEDWFIFVSLIMADDSAGKNSYHYHDPLMGPWRYAPWDFNDSFGQTWQTARKGFDAQPEGYVWANELFTRLLASKTLGPPLRARYGATLKDVYAVDAILERYDAMVDETAASAVRDEGRWAAEYKSYGGWNWRTDFTSYDEEVLFLRQWIIDRWAFVAAIYG